jgi:cobalt/nickel transport system permease protein
MSPVPGGTTTHLVGVTLLAILRGPLVAFVCESLVLVVQALFFGAGGVTVLGVNALAMGLLGPLAGWLVHRALRRASERAAAFAAAWTAMQVSTALDPRYLPMPGGVALGAMLVPSLTVAGLAEGLYTAFALTLLAKARVRAA